MKRKDFKHDNEYIDNKKCEDCIYAKPLKDKFAGELKDCTLLYNIVCGKRPACAFFDTDKEKEHD